MIRSLQTLFLCLQGEMAVTVKFGGDPIPKSPFSVGVAAPLDLNKVTVDNLNGREFHKIHCTALYCKRPERYWGSVFIRIVFSGAEVGQEQQFTIDTKGAGGQGQLEVALVRHF